MKIVTAKEMQELDSKTIKEFGIPGLTLMENAGNQVMSELESAFGNVRHRKVTVVCGKGNNGGDGLVVARLCLERGATVSTYLLTSDDQMRGDAKTNLERLKNTKESFHFLTEKTLDRFKKDISHSDLVIDAILGTGLSSPVTGLIAKVIEAIKAIRKLRRAKIISVDIASGLHADTGHIMGSAVSADLTVTFALPKRGHFLHPGADHTGVLKIADIGIPIHLIDQAEIPVCLIRASDLTPHLSPRKLDSHKGTFGHLLVIAGSTGKGGAAVLTSLAALRSGTGLVTLATPSTVEARLHPQPPEIMTLPLSETPEQTLSHLAIEPLLDFSQNTNIIAIGPGLSVHPDTTRLVRDIIARSSLPMVIDADGLNALVHHLDLLPQAHAPIVLTPHPGEMARLCGRNKNEIQEDRIGIAKEFAQKWAVTVVLKGAHTIIATPEGELFVNPTGNPGMATAGTGDVLTGMIAGLMAQNHEIGFAVRLGVYLHGLAGDLAARAVGAVGFIASDVIAQIPSAFASLSSQDEATAERADDY